MSFISCLLSEILQQRTVLERQSHQKNYQQLQPISTKLPFYDVIIIDEAQDMIELYHKFLHKILHDLWLSYGRHPQLLVIGDEHQELYGFKGADFRYLTMAENIYPFSVQNNCWKRKSLTTSYRITGNIAPFINECVLMGNTRMIAAKPAGHSVDYYVGNPYDSVKKIAKYLIEKLNEGVLRPSYFFILSCSIKARESKVGNNETKQIEPRMRPIQALENELVKGK